MADAPFSGPHRPPPLARLSVDESTVSTTTNNELLSLTNDPEHHSIELSTLHSRSGSCSAADALYVNHNFANNALQGFSSRSSAFQSYRHPRRRKRAFAMEILPRVRQREVKERIFAPSKPLSSLPSYTTMHLLTRRLWLLDEANRYEQEGNFTRARPYLEECCQMDSAIQVNPLAAAHVHHKLGVLTWKIGSYHDSIKVLLKCLDFYNVFTAFCHKMDGYRTGNSLAEMQGLAIVLLSLGRVHVSLGELDPALQYARKSIAILKHEMRSQREYFGALQPFLARALVCMGGIFHARGQSNRALRTFKKCLQIQRTCLGSCHVDVATTLNQIGGIHENRGSLDEAMVCYTEALRIYRSQLGFGCSPLDIAVTLNNVGFIHHKWKQFDRALKSYREALSIFSLLLGPCHRNITSTKYNIAQAYVARGSTVRGLHLLKQVLRCQRVGLGGDHPDVAITSEAIATAYEDLGRISKACSYHERVLNIRIRYFGSSHMIVARTHDQLGQLHRECGRVDSARHCFREALIVYRTNGLACDDIRIASVEKALVRLDRMKRKNRRRSKQLFRRQDQKLTGTLTADEDEELVFDYEHQPTDKGTGRLIL